MKKYQLLLGILSFLVIYSVSTAQSKTNLELVDSLIHISINDLALNINNEKLNTLIFNSSVDYSVLKSTVIRYLQNNNFELSEDLNNHDKINYTLEEIKINYSEVFRDGLFGAYLVGRSANIAGSYFKSSDGRIEDTRKFNFTLKDSVLYSDISRLDNIAYKFSSAEIPEEPFFSSALEPVIAIGTAAVAVYLFFNIRSK